MIGPVVTLSPDEMRFATQVACARQIENLHKERPDAHGAVADRGWQVHIEGALGEMAFAKWRNRFWSGSLGDLRAADVGPVQIRTTVKHTNCLLLHKEDPDDAPFVLVTGAGPTFVLRGWIYGREGKRPEFWRDPVGGRPAFFVPQRALRPMARGQSDQGASLDKERAPAVRAAEAR